MQKLPFHLITELQSNIVLPTKTWHSINPFILYLSVEELQSLNLGFLHSVSKSFSHVYLVNVRWINYTWKNIIGFLNLVFNSYSYNVIQILHPQTFEILEEVLLYDLRRKKYRCMHHGMEDIRLFIYNKGLWATYSSKDHLSKDSTSQIGIGKIHPISVDMEDKMFRNLPYKTTVLGIDSNIYLEKPIVGKPEKNWLLFSVEDNKIGFIYRSYPLETCFFNILTGKRIQSTKLHNPEKLGIHNSIFMEWFNHYLILTHYKKPKGVCSRPLYIHKFLLFDKNWNLTHKSDFFRFGEADIYFAMGGIVREDSILFSLGQDDEKSLLISMDHNQITNFLHPVT